MRPALELWRRVARAVVAVYPRQWRDRYESELVALIDQSDPGPAMLLDVVGSALQERGRVLWTEIFGDRQPLHELASIVTTTALWYWMMFRVFDVGEHETFGPGAWTAPNLLRLGALALRAYVIVNLIAALLAALNRRVGPRADRWWIHGLERVLLLVGVFVFDTEARAPGISGSPPAISDRLTVAWRRWSLPRPGSRSRITVSTPGSISGADFDT